MNVDQVIARTVRLADRLATLTGNRDAAAGKTADEIAKAIGDARYALIQGCLEEQRTLRAEGATVRLPILRDLRDDELVACRADLTRKGKEARKARSKAELDAVYNAKRGIRSAHRNTAPARQRDPLLERIREVRTEHAAAQREAVKALTGLNMLRDEAEAAE